MHDVDGLNAGYARLLLEQYLENPEAVPGEWRALFESGDSGLVATHPGLARLRAVPVLQVLEEAGEPRQSLEQSAITILEERSPLLRDRLGILEVLLEQSLGIARVDSVHIVHAHQFRSSTRTPCGGA